MKHSTISTLQQNLLQWFRNDIRRRIDGEKQTRKANKEYLEYFNKLYQIVTDTNKTWQEKLDTEIAFPDDKAPDGSHAPPLKLHKFFQLCEEHNSQGNLLGDLNVKNIMSFKGMDGEIYIKRMTHLWNYKTKKISLSLAYEKFYRYAYNLDIPNMEKYCNKVNEKGADLLDLVMEEADVPHNGMVIYDNNTGDEYRGEGGVLAFSDSEKSNYIERQSIMKAVKTICASE